MQDSSAAAATAAKYQTWPHADFDPLLYFCIHLIITKGIITLSLITRY